MLILERLIPVGFLLYFLILLIERVQSMVFAFKGGCKKAMSTPFDAYTNTLTILSILATLVLLIGFNGDFFKSLLGNATPNYLMLVITSGVLLVSGMVHTDHTLLGLQFTSYAFLIISMIFKTILLVNENGNAFSYWFWLVFFVVFSMAIPVVYKSGIKHAGTFHCIESIVSLLLVAVFTYYLYVLFTNDFAINLMVILPVVIVAVGNAIILSMRWKEEANWFTLIFSILTVLLGLFDIVLNLMFY